MKRLTFYLRVPSFVLREFFLDPYWRGQEFLEFGRNFETFTRRTY